MSNECFICENKTTDVDYVSCVICHLIFHINCLKLNDNVIEFLNERNNICWKCELCSNYNSPNCDAKLNVLTKKLNNLYNEFKLFRDSFACTSKAIKSVNTRSKAKLKLNTSVNSNVINKSFSSPALPRKTTKSINVTPLPLRNAKSKPVSSANKKSSSVSVTADNKTINVNSNNNVPLNSELVKSKAKTATVITHTQHDDSRSLNDAVEVPTTSDDTLNVANKVATVNFGDDTNGTYSSVMPVSDDIADDVSGAVTASVAGVLGVHNAALGADVADFADLAGDNVSDGVADDDVGAGIADTIIVADVAVVADVDDVADALNACGNAVTFNNGSAAVNESIARKVVNRNHFARTVRGSCDILQNDVVLKLNWFHLGSFRPSISCEVIVNHLAAALYLNPSVISCYKLIKRGELEENIKFINFKIGVPAEYNDAMYHENIWPIGTKLRAFRFDLKNEGVRLQEDRT